VGVGGGVGVSGTVLVSVGGCVSASVGTTIGGCVSIGICVSVCNCVGKGVLFGVGGCVDRSVGVKVGSCVGDGVDAIVGGCVSIFVGVSVCKCVGGGVCVSVGGCVGGTVLVSASVGALVCLRLLLENSVRACGIYPLCASYRIGTSSGDASPATIGTNCADSRRYKKQPKRIRVGSAGVWRCPRSGCGGTFLIIARVCM